MNYPTGPILPIVVIDSESRADALAEALIAGGIHQVEVTLRTPAALASARLMAMHTSLRVGIGTALSPKDVELAAEAGAEFVVSPGLVEDVVAQALEIGLTPIPGVATATELARAASLGLTLLKLFPVEQLGGVSALSSFHSVFPDIQFMPSGGIGPANARQYLEHPAVATVGGSWMVPRALIREGDFTTITALCRAAQELAA